MLFLFGADGYLFIIMIKKISGSPIIKKFNIMQFILIIFFLFEFIYANETSYFQQHVAYYIDVSLDDSAHTLSAYEKIIYTIQ